MASNSAWVCSDMSSSSSVIAATVSPTPAKSAAPDASNSNILFCNSSISSFKAKISISFGSLKLVK